MAKRTSLSKKIRFEVLKRDSFKCQYCGAKAPEVLLQIDHINPVARGGKNNILNLVTSCAACNGGKGARSLSDDSVVAKQHSQLSDLQSRREQVEMMLAWQASIVESEDAAARGVADIYAKLVPGWSLNDAGLAMVRTLVARHGLGAVLDELRSVTAKHVRFSGDKATQESVEILIGSWKRNLQWQAEKERDPVGAELRYIRGILRNRLQYCPLTEALQWLSKAYGEGVHLSVLREVALYEKTWTSWQHRMQALIDAEAGRDA